MAARGLRSLTASIRAGSRHPIARPKPYFKTGRSLAVTSPHADSPLTACDTGGSEDAWRLIRIPFRNRRNTPICPHKAGYSGNRDSASFHTRKNIVMLPRPLVHGTKRPGGKLTLCHIAGRGLQLP
jgi:hypothetical protein